MRQPWQRHNRQTPRSFVPRLEELEPRMVPSDAVVAAAAVAAALLGGPPNIHIEFPPLQQGGAASQVGSTLILELASTPSPSQTQIVTDGRGDVALSWDGGSPHYFFGVQSIDVFSKAASNNIAFTSMGPLQSPQHLNLLLAGINNLLVESVPGGAGPAVNALPPVPTLHL
jgi:hypothetical protein